MGERAQSLREERANSISHGIGLVLALVAVPLLVQAAAQRAGPLHALGAAVFGATMILVYFASAAYHALPPGPAKRLFHKLDHAAIFLFIAGSYTPFALAQVDGLGWSMLALVWTLSAAGVTLKVLDRLTHPWLSTAAYVALGWIGMAALAPVAQLVADTAIVKLLVGGSASYTAGAVFFLLDSRVRYAHFVWHLFVLLGSACHFAAALWQAGF